MSERILRINELIKHEINQLLLHEVEFDDALVTITNVETSSDFKHAKIKIIVYPESQNAEVFKKLEKNIYIIQQGLNKRLKMKWVPKIQFELDEIESHAQEVEKVLQKIKK